jgi:hypothetical protein
LCQNDKAQNPQFHIGENGTQDCRTKGAFKALDQSTMNDSARERHSPWASERTPAADSFFEQICWQPDAHSLHVASPERKKEPRHHANDVISKKSYTQGQEVVTPFTVLADGLPGSFRNTSLTYKPYQDGVCVLQWRQNER